MRERSIDRLFRRYRDHRDARALAELFDRIAPELARIATHFSKTSDEVEDAVQTAFLTAIERPEMVDPERPFLPWMIGVVTNRCRDLARKRDRTPEPDRLRQPEVSDPVTQAAEEEFQIAVKRGVERLAPKYKSAVQAHLAEGLAPREIAAREGITPNAASVRLHRGLRALRKALPASFALGAVGVVGTPALGAVRRRVLEAGTESAVVAAGAQKGALVAGLALAGGAMSLAAFMFLSSPGDRRLGQGPEETLSSAKLSAPVSSEEELVLAAPSETRVSREAQPASESFDRQSVAVPHRVRVRSSRSKEPLEGATCLGTVDGVEVVLARTNAKGIAEFDDAQQFAGLSRVDAEGHVSWRRIWVEGRESRGIGGFRHAVPLPEDLSEILLDPGSKARGVVLDKETREPIAGAMIYAFQTGRGMPKPILDRPVGESDKRGEFIVDGGVPLTNEAGGNVMLFAVASPSSERPELTGRAAFPVLGTEDREPVEILCIPSLRAAVTVRDESGQPLSGVRIAARPGSPPWGLDWTSNEKLTSFEASHPPELLMRFRSETDASGVALFDSLAAGSPSGMTGSPPYEALWGYGFQLVDERWSGQIDRVYLAANQVEELELTATRKRSIRVTGLCERDGEMLAGARIGHVHPKGKSTTTDGDGRFDLGEFDSVQFPLQLSANPTDGPAAMRTVALPESDRNEVFIRFEHAVAVGVHGTLVDENGDGVQGAELLLITEARGDRMTSRGERGEFEFLSAGPGRHELRVIAPDGRTKVLFVEAGPDPIEVVLPSLDAELSIVLELVTTAETSELPVPHSAKFTNEMGGTFTGSHDSLGRVTHSPRRIIREAGRVTATGVPAGLWIIEVECDDYPAQTLALEIEEGSGSTQRRIVFEPPGILRGRVPEKEEDQAVMLGFSRILLPESKSGERALKYWECDMISGLTLEPSFTFDLVPDAWWVTAHQGDRAAFMHLDVESGENPPIELALEPYARIDLDAQNLPPGRTPLLEVRVGVGRVRYLPSADFDSKGMFYRVPPGPLEWRVSIVDDRLAGTVKILAEGKLNLAAGENQSIEL